jgi:hypothetical protein
VFSGKQLKYVGMPVGGIGCGQLYLGGDGRLWLWDIFKCNYRRKPDHGRRYCDDISDGFVWNITILDAGESGELSTPHLVVDFREIFTLPRTFIESLVSQRTKSRLRLLPPYREHLSQAFARFFMRVGLPVPIQADWLEVYS